MIGTAAGTFAERRGNFRGFVQQSVNHQIRWPWRVIDVRRNREVAVGVEITREAGIAKERSILGWGVF